jgi:hypothetical protein
MFVGDFIQAGFEIYLSIIKCLENRETLTGDHDTRWTLRAELTVRISLMTVMILLALLILNLLSDVSPDVSSKLYTDLCDMSEGNIQTV